LENAVDTAPITGARLDPTETVTVDLATVDLATTGWFVFRVEGDDGVFDPATLGQHPVANRQTATRPPTSIHLDGLLNGFDVRDDGVMMPGLRGVPGVRFRWPRSHFRDGNRRKMDGGPTPRIGTRPHSPCP
jgi:hypothetical protein